LLLTLTTALFGGPFLRVLRKSVGSVVYWTLGILVGAGLFLLKVELFTSLVLSVWISVGLFTELEEHGVDWWKSGLISTSIASLFAYFSSVFIMKQEGLNLHEIVKTTIEEFVTKAQKINSAFIVDTKVLIGQIPSAMVGLIILVLGISLIYERKIFMWFRLPRFRHVGQVRLLEFRLPDYMIWISMVSFLFSFMRLGSDDLLILGSNVFNVALILYFFQGLAVTEVFLLALRAGLFFRLFTYFILIGQLFFVVSAIGVIDFWVDFRRRFKPVGPVQNN
jgi:hypothetical protein